MDYQQQRILNTIYNRYKIKGNKIVFKQYRNLKEFTFFNIERTNPNHIIKLYGKPKRKNIKDGHYNKLINVGEILIYSMMLLFIRTDIFLFWLSCFILGLFCFDLCYYNNPLEVFYVNWHRLKNFNKNFKRVQIC